MHADRCNSVLTVNSESCRITPVIQPHVVHSFVDARKATSGSCLKLFCTTFSSPLLASLVINMALSSFPKSLVCLLLLVVHVVAQIETFVGRRLQDNTSDVDFQSFLIFFVSSDILVASEDDQQLFVDLFVDSYNEGNTLDPTVCDPYNRTAIRGEFLAAGFDLTLFQIIFPGGSLPINSKNVDNSTFPSDMPSDFPSDMPPTVPILDWNMTDVSNETIAPSESLTSEVDFDMTSSPTAESNFDVTPVLVQVDGSCDLCPADTGLFDDAYDSTNRTLTTLLRRGKTRRDQANDNCPGPDKDVVLDIFQNLLKNTLPNITVFRFVELEGNLSSISRPTEAPAVEEPTQAPTEEDEESTGEDEEPTEEPTREPSREEEPVGEPPTEEEPPSEAPTEVELPFGAPIEGAPTEVEVPIEEPSTEEPTGEPM
jgi:hypothetical protein